MSVSIRKLKSTPMQGVRPNDVIAPMTSLVPQKIGPPESPKQVSPGDPAWVVRELGALARAHERATGEIIVLRMENNLLS